jgi:hypothetical protein
VSDLAGIRAALQALPALAATAAGNPPKLENIFFPEGHAEVLDLDTTLVIGNRGMGKTFWTLALSDPQLRPEIAARYFGTRRLELNNLEVALGFADAEGVTGLVSRSSLESIPKKTPEETLWRAVLLRHLAPSVNRTIPTSFRDLVLWIRANPEQQVAVFREADEALSRSGRRVLFLFDQLDQIGKSWERIQELTQGLLKVSLAMKSYRNIKTKIFMRPDQAENKKLFQFPDASKILGSSRTLSWRASDLYGLLFHEIMTESTGRDAFFGLCSSLGIDTSILHQRLRIPDSLVANEENQGRLFDHIAGEFMGKSAKRGRLYTWIPTHLADGRGEISPRTFLKVMKTAAELPQDEAASTAISFTGIQEGVRRASETRLAELEEDYPWVSSALEPLKGILVPCETSEIAAAWKAAGTLETIHQRFHGASAPIDLILATFFEDSDAAAVLIKLLEEIGVVEVRRNGKINVPDIFRVKAGILRKGGITPQQRRRL